MRHRAGSIRAGAEMDGTHRGPDDLSPGPQPVIAQLPKAPSSQIEYPYFVVRSVQCTRT